MSFSFGPFFTCLIITFFLTGYLYIVLHQNTFFSIPVIKFSMIGILIILIRMIIPLNFPFTYSVYSYHFLPKLTEFTTIQIADSNLIIADFILIIWFIIAFILLMKLLIQSIKLQRYLSQFYIENNEKWSYLFNLLHKYYKKPIHIAIIQKPISPAITGLFTPTLILPDINEFSDNELEYICLHEIAHYKQHHIWLSLLMEIVCRIHWWNPLVQYMKKEYALFLELSNDFFLIHSKPDFNTIDYAELIIKATKKTQVNRQTAACSLMSFTIKHSSMLERRIKYILNSQKEKKHKEKLFLYYSFICFAVFLSVFFTPEASFRKIESTEENGVTQINEENAYILETENGYSIYVDGNFFATVDTIPSDLKSVPIYKKGGQYHEK